MFINVEQKDGTVIGCEFATNSAGAGGGAILSTSSRTQLSSSSSKSRKIAPVISNPILTIGWQSDFSLSLALIFVLSFLV
jgi:predicted outer membrane repeat protein